MGYIFTFPLLFYIHNPVPNTWLPNYSTVKQIIGSSFPLFPLFAEGGEMKGKLRGPYTFLETFGKVQGTILTIEKVIHLEGCSQI